MDQLQGILSFVYTNHYEVSHQDNIRGKRSEYITEMHTDMDSFGYKERQLQGVRCMYILIQTFSVKQIMQTS